MKERREKGEWNETLIDEWKTGAVEEIIANERWKERKMDEKERNGEKRKKRW